MPTKKDQPAPAKTTTKAKEQKSERPPRSRKSTPAPESVTKDRKPKKEAPASTPEVAAAEVETPAEDKPIEIFCAARKNIGIVVLDDKTERTARKDNGGYRIGVAAIVNGEERAVTMYNKKVDNQIDAQWFARLKAVECLIDWFPGIKKAVIKDEYGALVVTNRSAAATRYAWVARNKAEENGLEWKHAQITLKENVARHAASIPDAPQYFTREQRENYLAEKTRMERELSGEDEPAQEQQQGSGVKM